MKKDYFFFYSFSTVTQGFANGVTKLLGVYKADATFPIREVEKDLLEQMGEKCVVLYYKDITEAEYNSHLQQV